MVTKKTDNWLKVSLLKLVRKKKKILFQNKRIAMNTHQQVLLSTQDQPTPVTIGLTLAVKETAFVTMMAILLITRKLNGMSSMTRVSPIGTSASSRVRPLEVTRAPPTLASHPWTAGEAPALVAVETATVNQDIFQSTSARSRSQSR